LNGISKRNCLAFLAQLWDPLGFISPITIKFRIDLQELWSAGFSWDEILPQNIQTKWIENVQSMNQLLTFELDRKLKPSNAIDSPEVHGFSDGGEQAFGGVIYLRWKLDDGSYQCFAVMVKPFVAPLKKKSVPRLELLGCLALSRMYDTCLKALEFVNIKDFRRIFWVDSTTVLSWVKTPPRQFKPFVSSRVAEIQETVGTEDFRYVRSKSNPADALTREIEPAQLADWLAGPSFLELPEAEWPKFQEDIGSSNSECLETMREKKPSHFSKRDKEINEVNACSTTQEKKENPILCQLLTTSSSFSKVRRTLAYILRFTQNARRTNVKSKGAIAAQELQMSEKYLFKWCQDSIDLSRIEDKLLPKTDQDGLQRAHGRLEYIRSLPKEMRNPIILSHNHPLVKLLLQHLHDKRRHCGYKSLMHEARKRFWIVGLRGMCKQLTRRCVTCRKLRKKPLDQLMGQIPSLRVAAGLPPFSNTAMDMFGPVQIRMNRKTLKEAQVIIFTCITCVLTEEFSCDFKWQWNVPHASHQNGVVESLIKSVQQALNVTCKNQAFTAEQWTTFLAEIGYVVNSRPLYPSSDNVWESPQVTPNDILLGQHNFPSHPDPEDRINPRDLLRCTQNRITDFWKCWMKYFAPNLLPRNKWFRKRENVQVGDLVLELDSKLKRCQWKMALITDVYPGSDGLVRKVRMKTQTGEYDRPIHP
jgi:hypothetical protein